MANRLTCDRCGTKMKEERHYQVVCSTATLADEVGVKNEMDLCSSCSEDLGNDINNFLESGAKLKSTKKARVS